MTAAEARTRRPGASHRLTATGSVALLVTASALPQMVRGSGPLTGAPALLVVLAVATIMVLGVVWPTLAIRRGVVSVSAPADATVGRAVPFTVTVADGPSSLEVRTLDPAGAWWRTDGGPVELEHIPARRGVFDEVRIEVRTRAPLGLFSAGRVHSVALPTPLAVAPRPLPVTWRPVPVPLEGEVLAGGHHLPAGDLVRAVRPYAAGDPVRLVHWPTTARTGELAVRELEPPSPTGLAVVLDLTGLDGRAEPAAAYALGACLAVLRAGGAVVLCTHDAGSARAGTVSSPQAAGRRIAAAIAGPPGAPPEGWPVVEIGATTEPGEPAEPGEPEEARR